MKRRSSFFFVLAGLLAFSLLVSCSKGTTKGPTAAGGDKSVRAEITVEVFDRGTDGGRSNPTKNNWTDWIQKKLLEEENIAVSYVAVARGDETTALNNLMAAGTPPDVCLTYSGELIGNYRDQGGLFDIGPYIDSMLPDLKAFLGPDKALPGRDFIRRNMDSNDGKVWSLPSMRVNVANRGTFIRKDWLDKLGLPLPTTTEQWYETMKAFKEKDPGNVGRNRVIPFVHGNDVRFRAGNLIEVFMDPNLSDRDRWVNSVAGRNFLLPGYKEGVRLLNKMYNEGLLDPDFPIYQGDQEDNLIKSGVVGSFSHNWDQPYRDSPGLQRDLAINVPGALFVPCDPFTDSRGITYKNCHDAAGVSYFIPASAKAPLAAIRYINWIAKTENRLFLQIGPEGVTHDVVNGVPKIKPGAGLWIQNSPQNLDYTMMINGLDLGSPELNAMALANSYTNIDPQIIIEANLMSLQNAKPGPIVPVTLSAAGPYVQTLTDKGNVLTAEAITASPANFDRVWDDGIRDWLASGGQVILDERAAKYIP